MEEIRKLTGFPILGEPEETRMQEGFPIIELTPVISDAESIEEE